MRWIALCLLVSACSDCEPEGRPRVGDDRGPAESPPAARGPVGSVEGVVRLSAGAELPSYLPIDWSGRGARPEGCPPPHQGDRTPVQMDADRNLVGLMVAVDATALDETEVAPREPVTHDLAIRDCRLQPMFIAAVRGDTLKITNEGEYPFLPAQLGATQYQALMQGQSREIPLTEGNVLQFECAFAAPCGTADVVVSFHPLFAITGDGGKFRIDGVPANRALRIVAWHPLFLESAISVNLATGETETVQIEISPAPRPEPAPPPDTTMEGAPENQPGLF